jgi:hypothetical protein
MRAVVCVIAAGLLLAGACGPTGKPVSGDRRGDTNGRMFDFISSKPDGSEWTIRVRGNSLWVAWSTAKEAKDLGPVTLADKEAAKLWKLIERLDMFERDEGEQDDEAGTVMMRLREPVEDDDHELITAYDSRETEDEDVIALANYLIDLIERHHKIEPAL